MFPALGPLPVVKNQRHLPPEQLHKLRLAVEVRSWMPERIGADFVLRGLASIRGAAIAVGVKKGHIERAVQALRDGRDIGVSGRPHRLPSELRATLADVVTKNTAAGVNMHPEDITAEVCTHFLHLHTLPHIPATPDTTQASRLATSYKIKQPHDGSFENRWAYRFPRSEVGSGCWKRGRATSEVRSDVSHFYCSAGAFC